MKSRSVILQLCLAGVIFAALSAVIYAIGTGSSSSWPDYKEKAAQKTAMSLYDKGVQADKTGDYQAALKLFQQALKKDKNNPDILNMLAHSQRKLGMINESIENYWKALKLRPRFPQAREYMGEAYIQAILKEIETLKSYGIDGEEELNDLIKAFRETAARL